MTFESSKNLGGLGAILLFISVIMILVLPVATFIIGAAGAIMLLIGIHGLASYYKERGIFNNGLIGFLAAVIGGIVVLVVILYVVLTNITPLLQQLYPGWNGDWSALQNMTPDTSAFSSGNIDTSTIMPLITGMLLVWVLAWIVTIISGFFVRQSLNKVKEKSGVGLFGTAGIVILVGAFLGVIGIGYIIIWIGLLLAAIAFFQLRPTPEPVIAETPQMVSTPPPPTAV